MREEFSSILKICAKSLDPCMERREITRLPGSVPPVRRKRRLEKANVRPLWGG
nr:MAG TPA: hypothetical protein [Caudoviricetes sp.]